MTPLTVPCPHCGHESRIDGERLSGRRVRFSCPKCGGQVIVDPALLTIPQAPQETPQVEPQTAETAPPADAEPAPAKTADRRFAKLPENASFPSGIILGEDDTVIGEVQTALAALGSAVERIESSDAAREIIANERPELCIYVGRNVPIPPYEPMAPLTGLPPSFRRRLYLVLVCDNLKTLDGNAAFLYQVNMVLARRDLPHIAPALYSGLEYHERLYAPYMEAAEKRGLI